MKTELTKEESARLIELGISPKWASQELIENIYQKEYSEPRLKVFTLADILSIIPKEFKVNTNIAVLVISTHHGIWTVGYEDNLGNYINYINQELIDSLYQLLIWAIEHKYVNINS